jgi:flagellar motor switch protein FliN
MTEALSQDELDALLSNFGDDEDNSGDGDLNDLGGSTAGSGGNSSSNPQLTLICNEAASAFRNGAEGIGVMLASTSRFNKTSDSAESGSSLESKFAGDGFIIEYPLQSPVSGSIYLRFTEKEAKALISAATSTDASSIEFNDDQSGAAVEIITPALVAVIKSWSGIIGNNISTGQPRGFSLSAENPFTEDHYSEIRGNLSIEGILNDTVSLIIPDSLANEINNSRKPQESRSSVPSPTPSEGESGGKKPFSKNNLNLLLDVQMPLTVELGRTKMYVKEILSLGEGSILELDKLAGEPVDLMVNAKLIAKGEVIVIDENFGVRVTDIVSPTERLRMGAS